MLLNSKLIRQFSIFFKLSKTLSNVTVCATTETSTFLWMCPKDPQQRPAKTR